MSISSSLNAGVTGLASNASRLAAISDNIANSGTYGYKRAAAEFESMVITGAAGAAAERVAVGRGLLRFGHRLAVVHRDVPATACQCERDLAAQALARARDQHGARGGWRRGRGAGHGGQWRSENRICE